MPNSTNSIFLLPYGGGSAANYRSYMNGFPQDIGRIIPVELPGRGKRFREQRANSVKECAAIALQQIEKQGGPYVLHGHCMGALLAFETVKLAEANGGQLPHFIVVSGRNAPRHANALLRRASNLDDRGLFEELRELGGIPKGLNFEMAQQFLVGIRGDHAMFSNYQPSDTKIGVPILALGGRGDKVTTVAALEEWQNYTSKFTVVEWLNGDHYFILQQPDRVALHVAEFHRLVDARAARANN
jgi:medium-chain acyl-[acyl-carrier-protein] hydrolase